MSQFEFFNDGAPIEDAFKNAAKRLNSRLNEKLVKELGNLLCECADKRDYEGFRFLITRYPELINARDSDNDTPLIVACNMGSEKISDLCLAQPNVDINAVGIEGMTAFMWACEENYTNIGKALLQRSELAIMVKDEDGDTALILAVQSENSELVRLILERDGADVEDKDANGGSARSIVESFKGDTFDQKEILELIKAHKTYATKPAAKLQATTAEVGTRQGKHSKIPTKTRNAPEQPSNSAVTKTMGVQGLAERYPYPHSIAYMRWMTENGYETLLETTGKIAHEETKLRMPTIERFISTEDALYAIDGSRASYDPKALSICKQIGYDPALDYPLVSAESGATPKPSESTP